MVGSARDWFQGGGQRRAFHMAQNALGPCPDTADHPRLNWLLEEDKQLPLTGRNDPVENSVWLYTRRQDFGRFRIKMPRGFHNRQRSWRSTPSLPHLNNRVGSGDSKQGAS